MIEMSGLEDYREKVNFGKGHYFYNGEPVPRVTEIISRCTHEDYLMSWSNSLGFRHQPYKKVLQAAADYGTATHSALETYIKTGKMDPSAPKAPIDAFERWWKSIHENYKKVKVIGQEFQLTCPYFGGTYDMILSLDGVMTMVDFKTSNHITYKYFLQLAAYWFMLDYNKKLNIKLDRLIILRLDKVRPNYETFMIDLRNAEHREFFEDCREAFLAMVYAYWVDNSVSRKFDLLKSKKKSIF